MAILPAANKSTQLEQITPESLVAYEHEGAPVIGVAIETSRARYVVLNMRGRKTELQPARLHLLPGRLPTGLTSDSDRAHYLLEVHEQAQTRAAELDLAEIWLLVQGEGTDFTNTELCTLYFGEDSLADHLVLRYAVLHDRIYFKRRRELISPRPTETVEELKKAEAAREKRSQLLDTLLDEIETRAHSRKRPIPPWPENFLTTIDLLEGLAAGAGHIDNANSKELIEIIRQAEERLKLNPAKSKEDRAYNLLRRIGHFHPHSNLSLIRHHITAEFPEEALKAATQITEPASYQSLSEAERSYRRDYTQHYAITVDDSSTLDMDDALTLEKTDSGYELGVHITDVSAAIEPGSVLDLEAKGRASSAYLPEGSVNMFPEEIAHGSLSLMQGKPRRCVSCLFQINRSMEIVSSEICHTLIQVAQRYSYDEVDELLLGSDQLLSKLYEISTCFQGDRIAAGAIMIPKRMVQVVLSSPEELHHTDFHFIEVDESCPARTLVSELMILTNATLAEYACNNNIPLIYRSQPESEPGPDRNLDDIPDGPARDYATRATLKRSAMNTQPARHATLALDYYAQATSPIRRYLDLLNQRQIAAAIRGTSTPCCVEDLEEAIAEAHDPLRRVGMVTKESKRFWLLLYLKDKASRRESIEATVLRTDLRNPMVELEEIYIPAILKTNEKLRRGDRIELEIGSVDPRNDSLRLRLTKVLSQS